MRYFKMKPKDYYLNMINMGHIQDPIFINNEHVHLCMVIDKFRPIFITSEKYDTLDKLLTFLNRNNNNVQIYDYINNTNISTNDFINLIIEHSKLASVNIDILEGIPFFEHVGKDTYEDNIGTLWYDIKSIQNKI